MAGTGRTAHYNIPIYNAGDTVNDLNTYNNAMQIIDTELDTINVAGENNAEAITSLDSQMQKVQQDVTGLQNSVNNAQGTANGALGQIQEIVSPDNITFTPMANVTELSYGYRNDAMIMPPYSFHVPVNSGLQTPMTVDGRPYYVAAKIDNANPYRLTAGANIGFGAMSWFRKKSDSQVEFPQLMTATLHYDGVNTYLLISSDLSFNPDNYTDAILKIYDNIRLYNGQPKLTN